MNRTKITLPETLPDPALDAVYEEILKADHHEPQCVEKFRIPGSRAWASSDSWLQEHAGQEIEVDYLKG